MGAGRGFRMVLDAEDGMTTMSHPFQRPIVEIDMSDFHIPWQRFSVDRKTMVLRGDRNLSGSQIFYRLISPTMTKLQFCSLPTVGEAQKLVPKTNAEDRAPADQTLQLPM